MNEIEWIEQAKAKLAKQQEIIEQLTTMPSRVGIVMDMNPMTDWVRVLCEGSVMEVLKPADEDILAEVEPGVEVRIGPEGAITGMADYETQTGTLRTISVVREDGFVEINAEGERNLFWVPDDMSVEEGDNVLTIGAIVKKNFGKEDKEYAFAGSTNICWEDIGGLEVAKSQMREAIELPYQHPDIFKAYGKKPIKGVLLYGPPGCGKTMLGKAAATALARQHGATASGGFLYIKGPELLNKYVGVTEERIRSVFKSARDHQDKNGYPAIIFIDEADALLGKRNQGNRSFMTQTVVPSFLAEMDGLNDSGAMVLLATNLPDALDSAVVRDGRIDRKIRIGRPDEEGLRSIFAIYVKDKPLAKGFTDVDFVSAGVSELMSEERALYTVKLKGGEETFYSLKDALNGAMVTAVVENATSLAIARDLDNGTMSGIGRGDVVAAVDMLYRQNLDVDHTEAIQDYVRSMNREIIALQKVSL